ncbi:MAG TPA: SirB2 family protein [Burkholderiales bacterium]|nr:SirB2 family protein [Burkholderiales bacterium]
MSPTAYLVAKSIHVGCVVVSLAGFGARGLLMLAGSPWLSARFVRVAPHVVDSLLLASALWLAWLLGQYPFVDAWLTAKVLGLLAYIGFGMVALRRGRTRGVRIAALAGALAAAGYVVAVALTRDPRGPLVWLGV